MWGKVMNCNHCGSPVPIGAVTCPNCGTTIATATLPASVPPHAAPIPFTQYDSQPYNPYNNPYEPTAPPPPPPQSPELQPRPRRPNTALIIAVIIMVVLTVMIISGVAVVFVVLPRFTASTAATPTPTSPAATPTPTPTPPSPTPTPVTYPSLAATYTGTVDNTSFNTSANVILAQIKQNQGSFSGVIQVQQPLCGSGPFTGTVTPKGVIQFTDTPTDGCDTSITFKGSLQPDGSMSGAYITAKNQSGIFIVKPA